MNQFKKGMIIKMSGLEIKKENGVFEIENPWEKACSVYKLKKDGSRIKHGLDIFNYTKIEQYGEIITSDQVSAAITEINKQLKNRKNNEIVISYVSTDKKEYSNKCYIRVIKSIQTTSSIYAIPTNSIFQLTVNEKWGNVTWERIGKKGEIITSGDKSLMSWKNKSMDNLFAEGYLEIVERVETVRKDMEEVNEEPEQVKVIEIAVDVEEVLEAVEQVEEVTETEIKEEVKQDTEQTSEATYKTGTGSKGNGIEIYFTDKPSEEVRNQLKVNGYRWNRNNSSWWTIETPERLEFAQSICGQSTITENEYNSEAVSEPTFVSYPEIEINDLESGDYNISQELQEREHDANWVFRSKKRDHNKEVIDLFAEYQGKVLDVISTTDNEYFIYKLKQALQRFKNNYHTTYVKYLSQKANNPSWAVTGRSGRNMSQYNKKLSQQDKTMSELVEIPKEMDQMLSKYKSKIRKDKERSMRSQMENTNVNLIFKTERKEFTYMNIKENKQVYVYNNYWICKLWNCWRIFDNGKELDAKLKTTDTLETAKKYVSMLVAQEQKSA